jgi:hypothetical protein
MMNDENQRLRNTTMVLLVIIVGENEGCHTAVSESPEYIMDRKLVPNLPHAQPHFCLSLDTAARGLSVVPECRIVVRMRRLCSHLI